MRAEFDNMPNLWLQEQNVLRIFFGFEAVQVQEQTQGDSDTPITTTKYRGTNVDVVGDHSYGAIVSAIIRDKYPDDRKDAIIANRELAVEDPTIPKAEIYIAEYNAFQNYRAYAKTIAQQVIEEKI